MKWYVGEFDSIREVEVVRATDKFVVFASGHRAAIDSDWRWYRPTRGEVKAAMVEHYKSQVLKAEASLDIAKQRLNRVMEA